MADKQKENQIQIADNIPGAEYSNVVQVNHNQEEFQLTFLSIAGPSGRVVSKVITTPSHYKRLIAAMKDNLKKYEEQFGEVKETIAINEKEIGFKI